MDTVLKLIASDDVITLRCEKQKDAEPAEDIHMAFQAVDLPDGTKSRVVVPSLPPQRLSGKSAAKTNRDNSNRVSKTRVHFLLAHASDGMTPTEIQAALPDVPERTLHRWLKDLREQAVVTATKGVYRLANKETATATQLPKDVSGSDSDT